MTTQIKDATVRFALDGNGGAEWVQFHRYGQAVASMPRASLIEAVEKELNVIVIDRSGLPEVRDTGTELHLDGHATTSRDGAWFRETAMRYLALAEYLDAHPPVDEAQVEALTAILGDFAVADEHNGTRNDRQLARLLVQRGVKVER